MGSLNHEARTAPHKKGPKIALPERWGRGLVCLWGRVSFVGWGPTRLAHEQPKDGTLGPEGAK
jgi:hypothetical protein